MTIFFPSSASGIIVLLKTGLYFIKNSHFFTVTFWENSIGFYSALELKIRGKYERKEVLLKP